MRDKKKQAAYNRAWKRKNRKRWNAYKRALYAKDPTKILEQNAQWQKANLRKVLEKNNQWKALNPAKVREHSRTKNLKSKGLSVEQYDRFFTQQRGRCAICRRSQKLFSTRLCVDHCHRTGRVRGLLCRPCNSALGLFQDKERILLRAATYLKRL